MYNEHRPTTKQIIITSALTLGGIIVAVVVVGGIVGHLIGASAPKIAVDESQPASTQSTAVAEPSPPSAVASAPAATPPTETVVQGEPVQSGVQPKAATRTGSLGVVVIDAGHQGQANLDKEPVGPGSSIMKPKVAGGATGVATGNRESAINLAVALKLRDELSRKNVKVVMVRTKQGVNISNRERAEIGNAAKADLTIRIHCNGAGSSSVSGLMTIYPESNSWTRPIVAESRKAARMVHRSALSATGARDAECVEPPVTMTGFNWSKVPSVIVEMGFMSNPAEDRKLGDAAYQKKLARGMAQGVVAYLQSK